jgi:adenine-specific DNA-methyltransferase
MDFDAPRKRRGAFYTPVQMLNPMVEWAVQASTDSVLDGGAGESAFLVAATERLLSLGASSRSVLDQVMGFEIDADAAQLSAKALTAAAGYGSSAPRIKCGSFFEVTPNSSFLVDACIGNPPYIRYQSFSGMSRKLALERAAEGGVKLSALTSSWAPFLVHACRFLSPTGRLAQVLPAELLQTVYAQPVRDFLAHRFHSVLVIAFDNRVFPGALEEVVLVLAGHKGPRGLQIRQARNLDTLARIIRGELGKSTVVRSPRGKWTKYLLPPKAQKLYSELTHDLRFSRLGHFGTTDIGVVTGANSFFVLDEQAAKSASLGPSDLVPAVSRADHIQGLRITASDWAGLKTALKPCLLFHPERGEPSPAGIRYIEVGEERGICDGYKCRNRRPWWRVPGVKQPDLFITYMSNEGPRIVYNEVGATSTNTVHRFYLEEAFRRFAPLFGLLALNSVTQLSAELEGRSYGGGVLKLEPKECDQLLMPDVNSMSDGLLNELTAFLGPADALIREGRMRDVVERIDELVLVDGLGLNRDWLTCIADSRNHLRDRRFSRMSEGKAKSQTQCLQ